MHSSPECWQLQASDLHADCKVFSVLKRRYRHPVRDICGDFYVINARPWAVTLALTPQDELVLVQQFRFGVDELSWELPAGCVDEGEDPLKAGVRELLEESGYVGDNPRVIGQSWPNPALQNNTCTFVLVENARCLTAQSPDLHEELAVRTLPVNQVLEWARTGIIRHAMVHNALFYFEPWFRARGA